MVEIETNENTGTFSFVGGELCLDFTNTMSEYKPTPREDKLADYADLVSWGREAGVLADNEAQELLSEAERRPSEASNTFREARELRDAIHNIFSTLAIDASPQAADLAALNAAL